MTTALYRRYRPDTFDQVIGQEHVTEPLKAALRANRVTHAYLYWAATNATAVADTTAMLDRPGAGGFSQLMSAMGEGATLPPPHSVRPWR